MLLCVCFSAVGPSGVWEPLPPPDSVCELWGCLPDVRHQAPVQPPGPVYAHRQRLAGERARHARAQPALPRHAEWWVSPSVPMRNIAGGACLKRNPRVTAGSSVLEGSIWNWYVSAFLYSNQFVTLVNRIFYVFAIRNGFNQPNLTDIGNNLTDFWSFMCLKWAFRCWNVPTLTDCQIRNVDPILVKLGRMVDIDWSTSVWLIAGDSCDVINPTLTFPILPVCIF